MVMTTHHVPLYSEDRSVNGGDSTRYIMNDMNVPTSDPEGASDGSQHYELRLASQVSLKWFEGATVTYGDDNTTILHCRVTDQAALHGLLRKVRDLGLELLSVKRVEK